MYGTEKNAGAPFIPLLLVLLTTTACGADYAVAISRATHGDPAWRAVADALVAKHKGTVLTYDGSVTAVEENLRRCFPRYACFVARPEEVTVAFVDDVNRLTRRLDVDPYTDVLWGILTGYSAANALRIAAHAEPLTVHKVAAGTEVALEMCEEGVWFSELVQHRVIRKRKGEGPVEERGPADTTRALVDALNVYRADLFVTSGHATERDWQIGYRYRNGSFRSKAGRLVGHDTAGATYPIDSPSPKVYLPVGNCLMGHIDGPDAMALAFMNSAGVHQMIGYTRPTWYGYAGWGCLDYFLEQPGRFTFAEAFHANLRALVHRLETYFPEAARLPSAPRNASLIEVGERTRDAGLTPHDARGLLFDRDTVAFYGDPAWTARMAEGDLAWDQRLTIAGGVYTFDVVPRRGEKTFTPINTNGSQRGRRPIVHFLPQRIGATQVLEGAELQPFITDDFILVPNPGVCDPARRYRVVFKVR